MILTLVAFIVITVQGSKLPYYNSAEDPLESDQSCGASG